MSKNNQRFLIAAALSLTAFMACAQTTGATSPQPAADPRTEGAVLEPRQPSAQNAVTVDDLMRSGRLKRDSAQKQAGAIALPPPLTPGVGIGSPLTLDSSPRSTEPSLEAVFIFKDSRKAQISAGGQVEIVSVGERIGGWQVKAISAQAVDIERCKSRKCTLKTLHAGGE